MNLKEEYILDAPRESPRAIQGDIGSWAAGNCEGEKRTERGAEKEQEE